MREASDFDYFNFRDNLADDIRYGLVDPEPVQLMKHTEACAGVDAATAGEWAERFVQDGRRHLERRMRPK